MGDVPAIVGIMMKRFALVLTVVTLGACASGPEASTTAAPPPPQSVQAPGGAWQVVEDYAAEAVGALTSPYLGQVVTLDAARAVDPAGRLCKMPRYWVGSAAAGDALGHPAQPQAAHDDTLRKVVTVACDGAPFAVLVAQPDGSWLTRQNAWVLKLAKPVAQAPMPVAEPVTAPAAPLMPAAKAKRDPHTLVYLASYKTEAQAQSGFKSLAKASPILARQQPVTQAVDLGKKGHWVRLYGMATDEAERKTICGQLGKRVDECGARNRE